MTYIDLIREADYQVDTNRITLEEYDKMIAPLRRDVDALDKIRAEIEKAMDNFYYDEHDLGVRAGFRFALEIIDNHISGKEKE